MGKIDRKIWYNAETSVFPLSGNPEASRRENVSKLNEILEPLGCEIGIDSFDNHSGEDKYYLYIKVCPEAAADYYRRRAGRKQKMTTKLFTVKEVREMMEQRSAEDVATELGVSRSTLFRRLKNRDDEYYF